jgi:signal recognition particle GTPase
MERRAIIGQLPGALHEVLLVVDANFGQNAAESSSRRKEDYALFDAERFVDALFAQI